MSEKLHSSPNIKDQAPELLQRAAKDRGNLSPRHLGKDAIAKKLDIFPSNGYLAEEVHPAEGKREQLSALLLAGNQILGISHRSDIKSGEIEQVRLAVLPLGDNARDAHSARTLAVFDMQTLEQPRAEGVIKRWEEVYIGRKDITIATGVEDMSVSRSHLRFSATNHGNVEIVDKLSTNGTDIITSADFWRGGFDAQGSHDLAALTEGLLQEKPYLWTEQYADQTVVPAQQ
jgi:hypothetical protein